MFASGSLSLLHTGGSSSFSPSFIPTPDSYRSPPRHNTPDSRWAAEHQTIHLSRHSKTIDASHVRKSMGNSDDEQKHAVPTSAAVRPELTLSPAHSNDSHHSSPSPSTVTASGIAAMSLSFIINDDSESTPGNRVAPLKMNEYRLGSIEDSMSMPKLMLPRLQMATGNAPVPTEAHAAPLVTTSLSSGFGVNAILNTVCAKPDCYRTIRGPPGSFCKYHKQSRFCRAAGCNKSAKTGGYCISHGGGKRCSFPECTKSAKQGGLCISHGGGKRCSENGCTKSALVGGFCSAHGGGRKCKTDDCTKTALLGGFCIAHGGGKRCQVDGCSKSAVGGMLCVSHGGGKRCQHDGCNKGAVRNGVCIRHGAKRDGASSSNASASPSPEPSPVKSVKAENEFSS